MVATVGVNALLLLRMKPNVECRKLAAVLREKAKELQHDPKLRAEYEYLVRGFLRLATQFERDMCTEKKMPNQPSRKTAA